jgi:hypothetical protein
MALLILNNLAIPIENKHRFVAQNSALVLQSLFSIIQEREPDTTYLACLCLRNLTLVEDAAYTTRLLSFRTADDGTDLLALLETLTLAFAAHLLQAANIATAPAANRSITTAKYHAPNNHYYYEEDEATILAFCRGFGIEMVYWDSTTIISFSCSSHCST